MGCSGRTQQRVGSGKVDRVDRKNKTYNLDRKEGSMTTETVTATHRRASDQRINDLAEEVSALRTEINQLRIDVGGVLDAWHAIEGGLKVLGVLAKVAKFFTIIAGLVTAVGAAWYALRHGGELPPTGGK